MAFEGQEKKSAGKSITLMFLPFFLVKLLWKQINFLECTYIFYFDVKFLTSSVNVKNGMFLKPF